MLHELLCPELLARSVHNAHGPKTDLGCATITHPFHPFSNQSLEVLKIKKLNNVRLYSLRTDDGVICVPESWTDRYPPFYQPSDSPFTLTVLKELKELIKILHELPSSSKNKG